jgi:hypothetical protein
MNRIGGPADRSAPPVDRDLTGLKSDHEFVASPTQVRVALFRAVPYPGMA